MNEQVTSANQLITPLKRILFEAGKRQEELVELTGLKPAYISALCSGRIKSPNSTRGQAIASALTELLGRIVSIAELWPAESEPHVPVTPEASK